MTNTILQENIRNLLNDYVQSINDCDLNTAEKIWNVEDKVSFIHPLGYEHSFEEIIEHFYKGIMQNLFSKRELIIKNIEFTQHENNAFVEFEWDFYATQRENNEPIHTKGRESQFIIDKSGQWKICHIHYSPVKC